LIELISDLKPVKDFFLADDYWKTFADDTLDAEQLANESDASVWFSYSKYNKVIGYISLNKSSAITFEMHPVIKQSLRSQGLGKKMIVDFLKWLDETAPNYMHKVNVTIPVIFPVIINTAIAIGFRPQGSDLESYYKGGKHIDRLSLGLLRKDWSI
jgi:RimJ/RimL family protein N-acetyltransferase